jgi:hypothetical protein
MKIPFDEMEGVLDGVSVCAIIFNGVLVLFCLAEGLWALAIMGMALIGMIVSVWGFCRASVRWMEDWRDRTIARNKNRKE